MNAFVIAGSTPGEEDTLASVTRGRSKAMIDLAGKPMVQWVLEALDGAPSVQKICMVGLPGDPELRCQKPLVTIPDQGTIILNGLAGLSWAREVGPSEQYALLSAADIPAITSEMVEWRIQRSLAGAPVDFDYAVVEEEIMRRRFPDARRSYVRFRDATICGGDLHLVRTQMVVHQELWDRIAAARKNPMQGGALIGLDTVLLLLLRRLTLEDVRQRVANKLGVLARIQRSPYAELAMDVDKPEQLELLRRALSRRRKDTG